MVHTYTSTTIICVHKNDWLIHLSISFTNVSNLEHIVFNFGQSSFWGSSTIDMSINSHSPNRTGQFTMCGWSSFVKLHIRHKSFVYFELLFALQFIDFALALKINRASDGGNRNTYGWDLKQEYTSVLVLLLVNKSACRSSNAF